MTQHLQNTRSGTVNGGYHSQLHQLQQPIKPGSSGDGHKTSMTVTFDTLGTVSSRVMYFGFSLSIILAVIFRFEQTTGTHCRVPNYLPTISAAIGTTPSSYVWRFCMCLVSLQRLLFVIYRYQFYLMVPSTPRGYSVVCHVCFLSELIENMSLIGLSCISSSENYDIHEMLFISFQVSSMVHMLFMCITYKIVSSRVYSAKDMTEGCALTKRPEALQRKVTICAGNFLSFFVAIYFFFRHQNRCEPGVYSLFALFEYMVVFTNILFHGEAWTDFANRYVIYGGQTHMAKNDMTINKTE